MRFAASRAAGEGPCGERPCFSGVLRLFSGESACCAAVEGSKGRTSRQRCINFL